MSNSLDPDQAQQFVGPDLGPNCLRRLSADDTGMVDKELKQTQVFLRFPKYKLMLTLSSITEILQLNS